MTSATVVIVRFSAGACNGLGRRVWSASGLPAKQSKDITGLRPAPHRAFASLVVALSGRSDLTMAHRTIERGTPALESTYGESSVDTGCSNGQSDLPSHKQIRIRIRRTFRRLLE